MKFKNLLKLLIILLISVPACRQSSPQNSDKFTDFIVNPQESRIELFWKDDKDNVFRNIGNLKKYFESGNKTLRFAMNGGMYQANNHPLGLFIQNGKTVTPLNKRTGEGNFYLQPNGVFYIAADRRAFIERTQDFDINEAQIEFATQSGPMLIINGAINDQFKSDSTNLNIRNGVCVLENGSVLFSISRLGVNFYDFADHFLKAGCRNALYLDGYVSKIFLPEKNVEQMDGDFGVIIAVVN